MYYAVACAVDMMIMLHEVSLCSSTLGLGPY